MEQSAIQDVQLTEAFARLHERSRQEPYPSLALRRDRLDRMIALLAEHRHRICETIAEDYGGRSHTQSLIAEIFVTQQMLKIARSRTGRWMRPERRSTKFLGLPLAMLGARARVFHQPLGVVGVIGPWNFPINLLIAPLAGIFSAGNVAMLKPSEHTPETASLIASLVAERFNNDEFAVITGGVETARQFSSLPFDHIIYTGGEGVARRVLQSAASNLTPVTLELGGKSPVIISEGANIKSAARRIIGGKMLNNGQVCIAPDVIFAPRDKVDALVEAMSAEAATMAPDAPDNPDVAAIVNDGHFDRITNLIRDAKGRGAKIVSPPENSENRKLPISFVINPPDDSAIMREEIFGPALVIKGFDRFDEAVAAINSGPRPLALYYFGSSGAEMDRLRRETASGSIVQNDVIMQYTAEDLPFGGVGASGMGRYHGIDGFRTFSNARAEYRQAIPDLGSIVRPPFTPFKQRLFDTLTRGKWA